MPTALLHEIEHTRRFTSLEREALLSVERTAAVPLHRLGDTLKAHDITATQSNVLPILRGVGAAGLSRNDIRDRLVPKVGMAGVQGAFETN